MNKREICDIRKDRLVRGTDRTQSGSMKYFEYWKAKKKEGMEEALWG
jgi:hypothetical protein